MVTRSRQHLDKSPTDVVAQSPRGRRLRRLGAAVHDHVARAQLGHQRRVPVEHFHVPVLRGQLDRRRRVLEERALGSDQPHAQLIGFVSHKILSVPSF